MDEAVHSVLSRELCNARAHGGDEGRAAADEVKWSRPASAGFLEKHSFRVVCIPHKEQRLYNESGEGLRSTKLFL